MSIAIMSSCSGVESVPLVSSSIEKSPTLQAPHVVSEMNHVLGSEVDVLKVGSQQQEQLNLKTKFNFLNAVKGSVVDVKEVAPPRDVFDDGCELWKSTLVGHFVGQKLPYPVVNSIAKRIWGSYGLSEVLSSENGFYLFTFDSVDHDLVRVPVWVRLCNVPLEYWTIKGLSCIASAIGVPLRADRTILLRKRLSYARVCVEIDASKTLVKEYDLRCPNGVFVTISAEYEWIPPRCNNCNIFGHTTTICTTNKVAHPTAVAEGARKVGAVISKSADNKQNQFQWQSENENGCSTSGIHMSDCNDHATSDVCNVGCCEDKTPTSPHVLRDMEQEDGATSMGGDINGERNEKEPTSMIPTSPQTPNSTDGKTVNESAIKAGDSLEKKKKGSKVNKKSGSPRGGRSR
nr:uncharacterized protein LOC118039434 [Populus alba]